MNFRNTYLVLFILISLSFPALTGAAEETAAKPRKLPLTFDAKTDYIVDGDSVRVWLVSENALFMISLYGVDAPELPQPYGKKAKEFLEKTLKNKKLKVKIVQTGKYQTGLGYFIVDGEDLGALMVSNGFAEVDQKTIRQFRDRQEMQNMLKLEKKAKDAKLGMWVQGEDYESPIEFIMRTRKKTKPGAGKH